MSYRVTCGCILGFLGVFSSMSGEEIYPPRFSDHVESMTPQDIRQYAFCVAHRFSKDVADVMAISLEEQENALNIWKSVANQLSSDLDFLYAHAGRRSSTGLAAYEALEILHAILQEVLEISELPCRLVRCANMSLSEQEAREFEKYILEYCTRLGQVFSHFKTMVHEGFIWEARGDHNWLGGSIMLCEGRAEVKVKADTEGKASVEGNVSYSRQSDSGKTVSAEVSAGVERNKEGKVSGKAEVKAGVNWNR